jgi:hypothetical protein
MNNTIGCTRKFHCIVCGIWYLNSVAYRCKKCTWDDWDAYCKGCFMGLKDFILLDHSCTSFVKLKGLA